MEPRTSIHCGVDHSSGAAARFAGDLADRPALRLVLVYAVGPPISQRELGLAALTTDSAVIEELRADGIELLEEVAQELGPDRDVTAEIRIGGASELLREASEPVRAAFLVVGSAERAEVERTVIRGEPGEALAETAMPWRSFEPFTRRLSYPARRAGSEVSTPVASGRHRIVFRPPDCNGLDMTRDDARARGDARWPT